MENEELFNNDTDQKHNNFIDAVVPTLPNVFDGLEVDIDRYIRLRQARKRDEEMEEIATLKSELAAFKILGLGQDAFEVKKELLLKSSVDAFARLMYLYRSQAKLGVLFNLSGQILKDYIEKKKSSHPHHFRLFNLTCQEKEARFVLDFLNRHKAEMTLIDFHKENIDNIRRQDDKTCDKLYFAMMPQQDFASLLLEFTEKDNFFSYFGFNKENMRIFFHQKKSENWQLFAPNPAKKPL